MTDFDFKTEALNVTDAGKVADAFAYARIMEAVQHCYAPYERTVLSRYDYGTLVYDLRVKAHGLERLSRVKGVSVIDSPDKITIHYWLSENVNDVSESGKITIWVDEVGNHRMTESRM